MKQLGLVRAGSRRERSALTKSEARKFINQLIAHPRIRQKASELRPHEDIFRIRHRPRFKSLPSGFVSQSGFASFASA
jgi:hypothetical protein